MEIHRADPAYRTRALLLVGLTLLVCSVLLLLLQAWLHRVTAQLLSADPDMPRRWLRGLFAALGFGLAMPATLIGVSLRRMGLKSQAERRFPPAGWKTLRDVRVLRDAQALRLANRTRAMGGAALALAVAFVAWASWGLWRFG
jgi:hypothetical protein